MVSRFPHHCVTFNRTSMFKGKTDNLNVMCLTRYGLIIISNISDYLANGHILIRVKLPISPTLLKV